MVSVLLVAAAAWHLAAGWHFGLYPARTMARTTRARPVTAESVELLRFLAGLNLALALLAFIALFAEDRAQLLAVLAVANASQWVVDLRVTRLGLARGPMFRRITWGDGAFALLLAGAALLEA